MFERDPHICLTFQTESGKSSALESTFEGATSPEVEQRRTATSMKAAMSPQAAEKGMATSMEAAMSPQAAEKGKAMSGLDPRRAVTMRL